MTEGLEAITTAALSLALDAASLRQRAAAANIANVETEGYVPVRVDFEGQLEAARADLQSRGFLDAGSLEGISPRLESVPVDATGKPPKLELDVEVAGMAQNAAHYQVLLRALSKQLALLATAVADGKK